MRRPSSRPHRHDRNRCDEFNRGSLDRQSRFAASDLTGCASMEGLEEFIRRQNLEIFRRQIDLVKDDARRQWLLKRLAEEEAKVEVAIR
ncbi:hypothetical protein [Bradyrhizobium sp. Y36]|uniref:hypothetical protein n=1 Tax=Bradyrhizobium sp. Y36 TaxID=2035447 RepID=UPI001177BC11|nr:hypothetical protein [Bradyrhizobium sp. Y36]